MMVGPSALASSVGGKLDKTSKQFAQIISKKHFDRDHIDNVDKKGGDKRKDDEGVR
jgi:hypothetical protein